MQRLTFCAQTSSGGDSAFTDSVDGLPGTDRRP